MSCFPILHVRWVVIEHERVPAFWLAGLLTLGVVVQPQFCLAWPLYDTDVHGDTGGCSTDRNIG